MRFRITPPSPVAEEIKLVEKSKLVELMQRAAKRLAAGDAEEHIRTAVTWEGHSDEFATWLIQEVQASFAHYGLNRKPRTTLELIARVFSRLAVLLLLLFLGSSMLNQRSSAFTFLLLVPVVLVTFFYALGFALAAFRLFARLTGSDKPAKDEPEE